MDPRPEISVVVPAYNELESLEPLFSELRLALAATGRTWELLVVDDGSTDGTAQALAAEAARDPRVVPLDADLQNDPADLPRLLAALANADVVSGVRAKRNDSWVRLVSSRIANSFRRLVLGDPVTDIGCSFKAYRREALEGLPMFVGVHRFLPALCVFRGARFAEVELHHRARQHGISKYGVGNRLWRGLADLNGVLWLKSRMVRYRIRDGGRPRTS